ncbi:MAG: cysteine desulfurase/selenocysteine lyase [Planctomycetota bacterium]|jgi:cysteine desulfurase/selenocysteine lyase
MIEPLIAKSKFLGIDDYAHLCAGGESPMLKSHESVFHQFMLDKARGETARELEAAKLNRARDKCAQLFNVKADGITFLSSASEGINNIAYGLDWQAGDNVVVADVEFPSGILPWTRLEDRGVEIRIVRHRRWQTELDDIAELIDERTRVVAISHVSMFTGQRIDLPALSSMVRASNALLLLDATHAAGVVPVDASLADVMVSSCYKWLLGTHGAAVFYLNRDRVPDFKPPFLGWNSPKHHGGWESPIEYQLHDSMHCCQPGNASFISVYLLDNALDRILDIGIEKIESHALALSGRIHDGLNDLDLDFDMMTPRADSARAGNVCFMADNLEAIRGQLEASKVLIWGAYAGFGRLRISTHLYNDSDDVDRCIEALRAAV